MVQTNTAKRVFYMIFKLQTYHSGLYVNNVTLRLSRSPISAWLQPDWGLTAASYTLSMVTLSKQCGSNSSSLFSNNNTFILEQEMRSPKARKHRILQWGNIDTYVFRRFRETSSIFKFVKGLIPDMFNSFSSLREASNLCILWGWFIPLNLLQKRITIAIINVHQDNCFYSHSQLKLNCFYSLAEAIHIGWSKKWHKF